MRFEVSYNAAALKVQNELIIGLLLKKKVPGLLLMVLVGAAIMVYAGWNGHNRQNPDIVFPSVGLAVIFIGIWSFAGLWKLRREYGWQAMEIVHTRKMHFDETIVYEFEADYYRFKDMFYDRRIQWAAFKEYFVVDRNLFLRFVDPPEGQLIAIGADVIGEQGFENVLQFVATKVKRAEPKKNKES